MRRFNPLVAFGPVLMERPASLEQRLVDTTTAGHNADGRTRAAGHGLLGARRETDAGLALLRRMTNDGRVVARSTRERTTVTNFLLHVANDGTLGKLSEREDVADGERGFLSAVDEGTSVQPLSRDESLAVELVAVWVPEDNTSERRTTVLTINALVRIPQLVKHVPASVVDDILHDTPDVAISLSEVEHAQARRILVVVRVRTEL